MTGLTVHGHVWLPPDGAQLAATTTVDITAGTLIGVDPSESNLADHQQDIGWFPGARIGAAYGSAGEGVPGWNTPYVKAMTDAGYQITFSAKDTAVAGFQAHWAAMPPGDWPAWYTIIHECNRVTGGPTAASWRAAFTALHNARQALAPALRARVKLGAVFNWFPAQIGHNEGTPWRNFITNLPGLDWIGWDQYLVNGLGAYADPTKFTDLPVTSGVEFGVPVHVREFGVGGSQSDAVGATFVKAVVPIYRARGIASVAYFQYVNGVSNARITPTGRPLTFAAWKAACAQQ
jgi:hypothetical protein